MVNRSRVYRFRIGYSSQAPRDFYVAGKGTVGPCDPPKHLVAVGLYRFTRNPTICWRSDSRGRLSVGHRPRWVGCYSGDSRNRISFAGGFLRGTPSGMKFLFLLGRLFRQCARVAAAVDTLDRFPELTSKWYKVIHEQRELDGAQKSSIEPNGPSKNCRRGNYYDA